MRAFTNLRGDKPQEYFSDGLTEEVRGAPRRERDLIGPGNTALFSFTGRTVAAAERDLLWFPTEEPQEFSIGAALNRWVALGRDETALRLPRPDGCSDCAAAGIRVWRPPLPMSLRADPAFTLIRSAPRLRELRPPQAAWAKAQPDPLDL